MDTQSNQLTETTEIELGNKCYLVVHPLDDYPEEKLKSAGLLDPDDYSLLLSCDRSRHSHSK
jgi:hypothetical protein